MSIPSPFDLQNPSSYPAWRAQKLAAYPTTLADLQVELADPFALTTSERQALRHRITRYNLALFRVRHPQHLQENPLPRLLSQLGVTHVDHHLGAGGQGVSKLSPGGSAHQPFAHYIPYRQAPIGWHTDGYYHPADRQIRTLALYCQRPAQTGGENRLLDPEMLYIQLRDANPDHIRTLMDPEVMTIPARLEGDTVARPEQTGPVFSLGPGGHLHMRYTARTISIRWKASAAVEAALSALTRLLTEPSPYPFEGRLEAGEGLLCHNVLHARKAFSDAEGSPKRELYRLRCRDRMAE